MQANELISPQALPSRDHASTFPGERCFALDRHREWLNKYLSSVFADMRRTGSSYVWYPCEGGTIADSQNYWVGVSTPVFQELIGWRLYPMHAFFCALSFVLVYFRECLLLVRHVRIVLTGKCTPRPEACHWKRWTSSSATVSP